MAIGKLLPVLHCRDAQYASRPDRRFAAEELGQQCGLGCQPIRLEIMKGLVTPPLPFAEAERKAGRNGLEHNTVFVKLPTIQIGTFPLAAGAAPPV
jgi:hypothetical protein